MKCMGCFKEFEEDEKAMQSKTTIVIGDSRRMDELKDESVHLISFFSNLVTD